MLQNSMGMNWSMHHIKNQKSKSLSRKKCRNRERKKKRRSLMKTTKMKKSLMMLRKRVRKQFKQKVAWRLEQWWNLRRHCLLQEQAKRHWLGRSIAQRELKNMDPHRKLIWIKGQLTDHQMWYQTSSAKKKGHHPISQEYKVQYHTLQRANLAQLQANLKVKQ